MALEVVGAGLGRTGTLSLKFALERLGLGPCYHMRDLFERLDTDVAVWERAADGEGVDWDKLFEGFRAAIDFPAASFYRELADRYPAAKVILTVRPSDRWYRSFSDTIATPMKGPLPDHLLDWGRMVQKVIVDRVFGGDILDPAHMIASYERHNEEVRRVIAPQRLLVYDVAEGWEPLCESLAVPVPDEPFPKVNSTAEWLARKSRFISEPAD